MFEELAQNHPARAANMAFAMEALGSMFADSVMLDSYDWASLGAATLVDVGGGKGLACRTLAKHFPKLSFIVQDLTDTATAGQAQMPDEFKDRIEFMTHNFFTPQPVKGADAYYFRAIFHNWPDRYAITILQNLIPALKKGARVLIHDPHTRDPLTMTPWQDRLARCACLNPLATNIANDVDRGSNLRMKLFFNAHDREAGEWPALFARADPRFRVNGVKVVNREPNNDHGPSMALVEAVWEG